MGNFTVVQSFYLNTCSIYVSILLEFINIFSWYKIYVHPIVCEYWARMQSEYIENAPEVVRLTGDGQVCHQIFLHALVQDNDPLPPVQIRSKSLQIHNAVRHELVVSVMDL
jgi:hypothetical protein